jgi:acetyl-CoA carboxylase biotin carboxyl carrier protein
MNGLPDMTPEEAARILELLDRSAYAEIDVQIGATRMHIVRRAAISATAVATRDRPSPAVSQAPAPSKEPRAQEPPAKESKPGWFTVTAPMLGTFYTCNTPGAAPYVQAGDAVRKGDPLCLIEVMKLFQTVSAPFDGIVREIVARHGDLVEYGAALFELEPASGETA